ncbi:hypothetical protein LXM94_03725 [Rhizobium sp. TRM95111]|uniref:hypothetical protein n=1 Tax=Rhizobium alarense TaxID=2846851 RepID=UPI001F43F249|nr:hypothetical protein [Rhizobium alarense]MCF3639068.1 hypothetical protein [Rhizobium alarense]
MQKRNIAKDHLEININDPAIEEIEEILLNLKTSLRSDFDTKKQLKELINDFERSLHEIESSLYETFFRTIYVTDNSLFSHLVELLDLIPNVFVLPIGRCDASDKSRVFFSEISERSASSTTSRLTELERIEVQQSTLQSIQKSLIQQGYIPVCVKKIGDGTTSAFFTHTQSKNLTIVSHPLTAFLNEPVPDAGDPSTNLDAICRKWLDFVGKEARDSLIRSEDFDNSYLLTREICKKLDLSAPNRDSFRHQAISRDDTSFYQDGITLDSRKNLNNFKDLCRILGYNMERNKVFHTNKQDESSNSFIKINKGNTYSDVPSENILVCCHHKSGTTFLRAVFNDIAAEFGKKIWMKFYEPEEMNAGWDICFHQHSDVKEILNAANFRGIHCIRHPKSLIYSAAIYHEKCREPWVDVPLQRFTDSTFNSLTDRDTYNIIKNPKVSIQSKIEILSHYKIDARDGFDSGFSFDGRTYRQMLRSCGNISEKLIFEMRCFSQGVVRKMQAFPKDFRFFTLTLEEISHDQDMFALRRAFRHIGFKGAALERCLELASPHCLWNMRTAPKHATTGVSSEWRSYFFGTVEEEYRSVLGYPEQALGFVETA